MLCIEKLSEKAAERLGEWLLSLVTAVGTATSQHGALDRDGRLPSSSDTVLRLSHVDTLAQAIDTKEIEK